MKAIYLFCIISTLGACTLQKAKPTVIEKDMADDSLAQPLPVGKKSEFYMPYHKPRDNQYRASETKYFDLVHTKLELRFDWKNQFVYGKARLILSPHFYPQKTLQLDAKNFEFKEISLVTNQGNVPLKYEYDGEVIDLVLDKEYQKAEKVILFLDYIAKPNVKKNEGSAAITSDKGFYFINPDGTEPDKPRQIWTQGETESNSCWFPTIDSPNQKSTQEMYITVADSLKTISNGKLVYSLKNEDGTRTDYWKMDKPHAPYLFMLAIGGFAKIEDSWNGMQVNYYLDKEYGYNGKTIFGNTPEMLTYFSDLLGYPYPWDKYDQIVVHDYVSGAMENTTASVFMDQLQINSRESLDKNWDKIIAHELFHHWFGDLVTTESWSNLTLNEAFANYSEYLWTEYKYGIDEAQYHNQSEYESYVGEAMSKNVELIRFYYDDKEDMFDNHSYAKGGLILHMLRNYVGDKAFFSSLNYYLKKHEYQTVEAHDLRLAFEEVTGQDLNWFFNQWFFKAGHPIINVSGAYVDSTSSYTLSLSQMHDTLNYPIYRLPIDVDFYFTDGGHIRKAIWLEKTHQDYLIHFEKRPSFYVVDPERKLLAQFMDENTSKEKNFNIFFHVDNARHRLNAVEQFWNDPNDSLGLVAIEKCLNEDFWMFRSGALRALQDLEDPSLLSKYEDVALKFLNDKKNEVRAEAISLLAAIDSHKYKDQFWQLMNDSSYLVVGEAITAYLKVDSVDKQIVLDKFRSEENVNIVLPIANYLSDSPDTTYSSWFDHQISISNNEKLYYLIRVYGTYLFKVQKLPEASLKLLVKYASENKKYYIRYAAFQSLLLFSEQENVRTELKKISENEPDAALKEYFESTL